MSTIATLATKIVLDAHAFTGGLMAAKKATRGFQRDMTRAGSGVSTFASMMARGAGVIGVAYSTAAAARAVFADIAEDQRAVASLTTLTKSAEQAHQIWAQLEAMGAKPPFSAEQFMGPAKSLLAMGESGNTVIVRLKQMGDIAAATGGSMDTLADIYGKAMQRGTVTTRELNSLMSAGVPIIDQFAKQFGVGRESVKKLAEEGKIGFADLQKAFADMTAEGGKFFGAMDAQAKTASGALSTIGNSLIEIASGLVSATAEFFGLNALAQNLAQIAFEMGHGEQARIAETLAATAELERLTALVANPDAEGIRAKLEEQRLAKVKAIRTEEEKIAKTFRLSAMFAEKRALVDRLSPMGFSSANTVDELRAIDDIRAKLEHQQRLASGMTDEQARLVPILANISAADQERVRLMRQQTAQLEEQAAIAEQLRQGGERTIAGTRLPIEQAEARIAELQSQLAAGHIDQTGFDRGLAQVRNGLASAFGEGIAPQQRIGGAAALERGSSGAFIAVADFKRNAGRNDVQQRQFRALDDLLRVAREQRDTLDELARINRQEAQDAGVLEIRG